MIKKRITILLSLLCLAALIGSCTQKNTKSNFQVVKNDTIKMPALSVKSAIKLDSLDLIDQQQHIVDFYYANNYSLAWENEINRAELITYIKQVSLEGISPSLYPLKDLQHTDSIYTSLERKEAVNTDILFSKVYMLAAKHLYNGVLSPRKLYNDWDLDPKEINLSATLLSVLDNDAVLRSFDSIRPHHQQYGKLKKKLEELASLSRDSLPIVNSNFELDQAYDYLHNLKNLLFTLGFLPADFEKNDVYKSIDKEALIRIQNKHKIIATGAYDTQTKNAIQAERKKLYEKAIVNMERYRWFVSDYGKDYIIINIAAYNLWAISQQDTLINSKVIVGTSNRKTPILNSTLTSIVVNPTWTVPPTILKNDIVPKASKDSLYFYKQNFTLVEKSTGKSIPFEKWQPKNYTKYHYIQKGGPGNTLGRVKFLFKNNHAVYLHDTPNKAYFSRELRGLSSGCVRVENPFELAKYVWKVQGKQLDQSELEQIITSEKTTNFSLKETEIQVHQLYWTIDINNKEEPIYYNDLYKYDQDLFTNLK